MREPTSIAMVLVLALAGCGSSEEETAEPATAAATEQAPEPAPAEPEPDPDEACAQGVIIKWTEIADEGEEISRTKEEAEALATRLREQVASGESIDGIAREHSDSRAEFGGLLGTYERERWPEPLEPIRDPIFSAEVGELTNLIEAPFGYVFAERCPVEKVIVRHILIRYQGATGAPADVTRTKEEARELAQQLHEQAEQEDTHLAQLAREHSEDGSAEHGGLLPDTGRGMFRPPFERAAFALAPGQLAEVTETIYGFHIIERLSAIEANAVREVAEDDE